MNISEKQLEIVMSNYEEESLENKKNLKPYEGLLLRVKW